MEQDKRLSEITRNITTVNNSITALTEAVGKLQILVFPTDYVKQGDLDELRKTLSNDKAAMTCNLAEDDKRTLSTLTKVHQDATATYDRLYEEQRKRKVNINLNLPAKILAYIIVIIGGGFSFLYYWLVNTPEYLAFKYYNVVSQMDMANPGIAFDEALGKSKAGKKDEVMNDIKREEDKYEEFLAYSAMLSPLLDERTLFVHNIEYETGTNCALVTFRFKDDDIIWKAFILEDGSILTTDSNIVDTPDKARKTMSSKKNNWTKIK